MKNIYTKVLEYQKDREKHCLVAFNQSKPKSKELKYWAKELSKCQKITVWLDKRLEKYNCQVIFVDFRAKKVLKRVG